MPRIRKRSTAAQGEMPSSSACALASVASSSGAFDIHAVGLALSQAANSLRWGGHKQSGAAQLRAGLNGHSWQNIKEHSRHIMRVVELGGVLAAAGGSLGEFMSPNGPGVCDHNVWEQCANCVTSVPYALVGVHAIKNRKTPAGKAWGASMIGVAGASMAFHGSSGKWKTVGRRLDYWTIALSSTMMLRSVFPSTPAPLTAACVAVTPFRPFLVSAINSAAMELKYWKSANKDPQLLRSQRMHAATCVLGLGAFAAEEFFPRLPLVHSAWHVLSAFSVASINNLIADVEKKQLGLFETSEPLQLTVS